MGKAFILLILGAIILAAGVWYTIAVGHSVMAIVAALIMLPAVEPSCGASP